MEVIRPEDDVMDALEEQVAEQTRIAAQEHRYIDDEDEWNEEYERERRKENYGEGMEDRNVNVSGNNDISSLSKNANYNGERDRRIAEEDCSWENEENDRQATCRVQFPEEVQDFLLGLFMEVYARNVDNIRKLYENDFYQITEKYYENTRWPSLLEVQMFYEDMGRFHSLILTLYAELYYRHVFAKCTDTVTWIDRKNAWENYKSLLEHFIEEEIRAKEENNVKRLRLPMQWVWDILDEFAYQFQDTCRWRSKFMKKFYEGIANSCEDEQQRILQAVIADAEVWKGSVVFELLLSLVEVSDLHTFLKKTKEDINRMNTMEIELKYQLGYFSTVTLLRLYVLIGDCYTGLQMINNLEISPRALYFKVPACHVSLCYHMGFAYMMLRRYNDAIRISSQLLIYVSKQKSYLSTQTYQHSTMLRTVDRMYLVVLLCQALCNNFKLDETVGQTVKEKYSDKFYKLQQDNENTYKEVFLNACPKYINPVMPESIRSFDDGGEYFNTAFHEPTNRQLNLFMKEALCLKKVSNIRSFAKLYNNIQLQKLASLMGTKDKDVDDSVRSDMMCVKHKCRQQVWKNGLLLSGDLISLSYEIDFTLDYDMIHIKGLKSKKLYVEYFLKQINQYQSLLSCIQNTASHRTSKQEVQREKNYRSGEKGEKGSSDSYYNRSSY